MTLRGIINGSLIALAILGVGTALALVLLTGYLNQTVQSLQHTMTAVRLVEQVELELRRFSYRSNIFALTGDSAFQALRGESEVNLLNHLVWLDEYIEREDERLLLLQIEESILEYLAVRRELEAANLPLARVIEDSSPSLNEAILSIDRLVQAKFIEVDQVTSEAASWDRWANVWALAAAAVLLFGIAIVLFVVHRKVYMPLWRLREGIHEFGAGDQSTRVHPAGPPELREIGSTFNHLADSLQQQRENRVAFLGGVAHDLRNPLTAISGYVEVLGRRESPPPEQEIHSIISLVGKEAKRLTRMLDDLLDTAYIDAGTLEIRMTDADARDLPVTSVELYRVSSDRHELVLAVGDEPLPVRCDIYRIEQVLNNLISNAIKYSPEGGRIDINVERKGDSALLSVTDEGIGISAEGIQQLYQPFRRLGPASESIPGAGLGLSVVRRIVEAHGGMVGVESSPGEGSTFWFTLPLRGASGTSG